MSPSAEPGPTLRARLAQPGLEFGEVMALVTELERQAPPSRQVRFGLSANVSVDILEPYLRRQALVDGYRAMVDVGAWGDHLGNIRRFRAAEAEVIIIMDMLDNLAPSLESTLPWAPEAALAALGQKVRDEIRLVLEAARGAKVVLLCLFHRLAPPSASGIHDSLDTLVADLNQTLRQEAAVHPNVHLLRPAEIVAKLGWQKAFLPRFYYRFRAPYSPAYCEELARQVSLASRGAGSYYHKVLVLDADNTLWGGIVGEDLPGGIKLGPHDYPGNIYWHAQQEFLALQKQGVLLCLCSKNNPADVDAVLKDHPHMVLREEHFVARQVGWTDKPESIRQIASKLNVGLDALVVLDDSTFECEAIRSQLPGVLVLQVPSKVFEYPELVHKIKELFLGGGVSEESRGKTEQYRLRTLAEGEKARFATQEEYLVSLGLRVEVRLNEKQAVTRIAELTAKSNQFNLTTRRYGEGQIRDLMESTQAEVFSLHVHDRFGDSGLTGVVVLRYDADLVEIDSVLMSCRVLGRGVELCFWAPLVAHARARGALQVMAVYIPTAKNIQVKDFFDRLGLPLRSEDTGHRSYQGTLAALSLPATPHIEVICDF